MKIKGDLPIPRDEIQKILDAPIPWEDEEKESMDDIKNLVAQLTPQELEIAAQTSYAYWLATLSDRPPSDEEREKMAMREARRTLFKNSPKKALKMVQDTMKLRVDKRIDLLRSCFTPNVEYDNQEDEKLAAEMRLIIEEDMVKQIIVARGQDKENLAIMSVFSRTELCASDDAFVLLSLYVMERAIAATEYMTLSKQEKIMVVADFGNFDSAVSPTWNGAKTVAMTLQHNFPQRLKRMAILDPPFWIRTLYSLVSPFLDPVTRKKFIMCSGEQEKLKLIQEVVDADQAMPFMRPDGQLSGTVDAHHYVKNVPFHMGYYDSPSAAASGDVGGTTTNSNGKSSLKNENGH